MTDVAFERAQTVDRHVVIVTGAGSFTTAGDRLTGPVDTADKLAALIDWAHGRGLLQPLSSGGRGHAEPPRLWLVGAACRQLLGSNPEAGGTGNPVEQIAQVLASQVSRGWELRPRHPSGIVLSHEAATQRISVEIVAESRPWLAGGNESLAEDAAELGRRLQSWYSVLATLPAVGGAASGAALYDHIRHTRAERGASVVSEPGMLPDRIVPDVRIQPPWTLSTAEVQEEFERCEELVLLAQECPQLAAAGTLTFGHGIPQVLTAAAATAAVGTPKRPFGLWRVLLPAASSLAVPEMLPLPHPQMKVDESAWVWLTTEDLDGMAADIRDGGAGLAAVELNIDEAIVWPQQRRFLETWATRLRDARQQFAGDPPLRGLAEAAAADYLEALTDPGLWAYPDWRHHFQPVWAAAIAARIRFRGRRAAMRISREYRVWPVYMRDATMIYPGVREEVTGDLIDLADRHSRLGRMTVARRAGMTDETILALLSAQDAAEVAEVLTAALDVAVEAEPIPASPVARAARESPTTAPANQSGGEADVSAADNAAPEQASPNQPPAVKRTRSQGRSEAAKPTSGGLPAAVLHTDGLWLGDGTRVEIPTPLTHVGNVAELAYAHSVGYQLTPKYSEPGQIWITDAACRAIGIDVDGIDRRDRAKSLRQLTAGIDFVTLAVAQGWKLGGGGEDPNAHRMGTWTRVYRDDKRGVMIALIPGMGSGPDETPILADEPTPAQIAHRLKLLADALRFPWKINAGVTAVDMMLQARTKTWSPQEWRDVVFASSKTTPPFGIGDVESDFDWSRPPTSEERRLRYVHAYDRGGSYVAGIAGLELPIGEPVHHPEGAPFDAKMPGYWCAHIPESSDWRLPYVLNPRGLQFSGPKWVTTPTLERAAALGYHPEIVEAWLWPQHGRVLLGWYERFRDASTALDIDDPDAQAARDQAKVIRTHGIGIIGSDQHLKGKPAYSPERRLHVIAKAKANIVYRLHKIGEQTHRWPLAVATDTVLYASDDPDPATAWPGGAESFGRGFGQYKPEGSGLLVDQLEYLNGQDYRGKPDLIPAAQWTKTAPAAAADTGGSS